MMSTAIGPRTTPTAIEVSRARETPTAIGAREASIFTCLATGFIAPIAPLPDVRDTDALATFDDWLARAPRLNRVGLRLLLELVDLAPIALGGRRRLRRMTTSRSRRWLEAAERVPIRALRELVRAVKTMILISYYGDPAVMAHLGYDAPANVARGRQLRHDERRP
jgi:hypothetical protein